ncbi:MAG: STAS domain-containing protein [Actinomycetales bacterium]|nr:STAS domain-containing protein [Actinomycetales bacterium]
MNQPQIVLIDIDEIDLSTAPAMDDLLRAAREVSPLLVVDMSRVEFMSAEGIKTLMATRNWLAARAGRAVLAGCRRPVLRVLSITGMDTMIDCCYSTVDEAVQALVDRRHHRGPCAGNRTA